MGYWPVPRTRSTGLRRAETGKQRPGAAGESAPVKVVIPGGTGQVGTALRRALRSDGHEVVVLTRRAAGEGQVSWDGERLGPWAREVDDSDVVINLAGRSVSCRYTKGNLTEMMRSRVRSARVVRASGNPVDGGAGRARDPHRQIGRAHV